MWHRTCSYKWWTLFEIDAGSTEVKLCIVLDEGELPHIFVKDLLSALKFCYDWSVDDEKEEIVKSTDIDCESAIISRDTKTLIICMTTCPAWLA